MGLQGSFVNWHVVGVVDQIADLPRIAGDNVLHLHRLKNPFPHDLSERVDGMIYWHELYPSMEHP